MTDLADYRIAEYEGKLEVVYKDCFGREDAIALIELGEFDLKLSTYYGTGLKIENLIQLLEVIRPLAELRNVKITH